MHLFFKLARRGRSSTRNHTCSLWGSNEIRQTLRVRQRHSQIRNVCPDIAAVSWFRLKLPIPVGSTAATGWRRRWWWIESGSRQSVRQRWRWSLQLDPMVTLHDECRFIQIIRKSGWSCFLLNFPKTTLCLFIDSFISNTQKHTHFHTQQTSTIQTTCAGRKLVAP